MSSRLSHGTPSPAQRSRKKEFVEDTVRDLLQPGAGVALNYNDGANTLSVQLDAIDPADLMLKSVYDTDDDGRVDRLDEDPELLTITTNGQTVFTLSRAPLQPALSRLTVNDETVLYGVDYTISLTTLTWISTKYPLATTDTLHIIYR